MVPAFALREGPAGASARRGIGRSRGLIPPSNGQKPARLPHEGLDAETLHVTLEGRGMWVFGYVNGPSLATKPYASAKPDGRAIGYRFAHRRADPATRELLREACR
jgi:hypothetical protein